MLVSSPNDVRFLERKKPCPLITWRAYPLQVLSAASIIFISGLALCSFVLQIPRYVIACSKVTKKQEQMLEAMARDPEHGIRKAPLFWPVTIFEVIGLLSTIAALFFGSSGTYSCNFSVVNTVLSLGMPGIVAGFGFPMGCLGALICFGVRVEQKRAAQREAQRQRAAIQRARNAPIPEAPRVNDESSPLIDNRV